MFHDGVDEKAGFRQGQRGDMLEFTESEFHGGFFIARGALADASVRRHSLLWRSSLCCRGGGREEGS